MNQGSPTNVYGVKNITINKRHKGNISKNEKTILYIFK